MGRVIFDEVKIKRVVRNRKNNKGLESTQTYSPGRNVFVANGSHTATVQDTSVNRTSIPSSFVAVGTRSDAVPRSSVPVDGRSTGNNSTVVIGFPT